MAWRPPTSTRSTSTARSRAWRRSRTASPSGGRRARSRRSCLKDNEVQYAVAWSGRVAGQKGIDYSFNQGQLDLSFFAVPKGADANQKAAAMGILYEMSVPENQARAAEVVSYTGNSPKLEPLLPQDRLGEFPTTSANKQVQILVDAKWWFENADAVETRWQEFKLGL